MEMFYHLVACDTFDQLHYLGRCSDVLLKREPDKTLDLADGDTHTGSEKLTFSCKIYEEIVNPINDLLYLFMLPASGGNGGNQAPNISDAIRINMTHAEYTVEAISGDFEAWLLTAVQRHSVAIDPVEYLPEYYMDYLFIYGIYERSPGFSQLILKRGSSTLQTWSNDWLIVPRYYCFMDVPMGYDYALEENGVTMGTVMAETVGAVRIDIG
ncbi:MAG TPA: hypothetical protein PL188_11175 [Candidatus Cloacimonadota bacterium]|nr:hypothetical protein [Candidatus Cloacimonadota bacterium]